MKEKREIGYYLFPNFSGLLIASFIVLCDSLSNDFISESPLNMLFTNFGKITNFILVFGCIALVWIIILISEKLKK
ncbi:hypothetical protein CO115_01665 [Candidatus Falkowbacteria bacterium CG_4_9_14_3_um_filter_36_9]|uniref:MotA/TolQ/ExbB proton channel domain-containing protein n=2 Tax=Candidatus Falkowiibacteriota TaxID=1752728 RepID=A0A1J4TAS2_9BACT|nr:MAG: hypothetical protein AUJ27_00435 [Candidatus Falkowbacteria bacterium CG1_02_37_44]PIV51865.1 MAG: hypothetical protein COS18_01650 [Candidatus Falkowbacteria bacterium CG02_land_8_20_14_3_00_36_14]PIX12066.1 MAG: hypothetical protein COZ73_01045 [Candidatus Falkowbacteria bacterium CG_4_8_14_3_um_filter_36_11]PJA10838.1 MAG: hypothetical protein COX67_02825 [Candidatus Falkowbacteria bacterium CG_4_10_14_0_2_um_filter_36_22]PJB20226.1 MAG: hypothetical protein CO115_01665 [Candidatus F